VICSLHTVIFTITEKERSVTRFLPTSSWFYGGGTNRRNTAHTIKAMRRELRGLNDCTFSEWCYRLDLEMCRLWEQPHCYSYVTSCGTPSFHSMYDDGFNPEECAYEEATTE